MDNRHEQEWDSLAAIDPLWAILSDPSKRLGRWQPGEFMATGERDVAHLLGVAERSARPLARARALDFGCGVGRLTRALASRFGEVIGVDISGEMIRQAEAGGTRVGNIRFVHDNTPTLVRVGPGTFDLVLSLFVVQHFPAVSAIAHTVGVLASRVGPGGVLILQVPAPVPLRHRLQPRRRLYRALAAVGVRRAFLQRRLGLTPIRMTGIPQVEVRAILLERGLTVLEVHTDVLAGTSMESNIYFATR
jgi:2-polyprenyl-3-methyl-5-hydroxy-6-metoxy-1,4-benzoquinol methylase